MLLEVQCPVPSLAELPYCSSLPSPVWDFELPMPIIPTKNAGLDETMRGALSGHRSQILWRRRYFDWYGVARVARAVVARGGP